MRSFCGIFTSSLKMDRNHLLITQIGQNISFVLFFLVIHGVNWSLIFDLCNFWLVFFGFAMGLTQLLICLKLLVLGGNFGDIRGTLTTP